MKVNYHYGESDNGRLSADIKSLESKAFMAEVNQEKQSSGNIPADLNTSEQAELKSLNVAAEKLDRLSPTTPRRQFKISFLLRNMRASYLYALYAIA